MSLCRHDFETLTGVTDELDGLLSLFGVNKADRLDPLKSSDLGKISRRIGGKLKRAAVGGEAAAMKAAIDELDVDWVNLDAKGRNRVIEAARRQAKKVVLARTLPVIKQVFTKNVKPIYGKSKKSSIQRHNLQINFALSKLDADIAEFVANSQSNFVTNQYGQRAARLGKSVRKIVSEGVGRGAGSIEIVKDLRDKLPSLGQLGRKQFYWEVVASAFANRARNYAHIASYGESGFSRYLWESVLDEVTTETCRFLHGKSFSTGDELRRAQVLEENADNPEKIKQIQPWVSVGRNADGEQSMFFRGAAGQKRHIATVIEPAIGKADAIGSYSQKMSDKDLGLNGVSMPPIHGLCRSTTVPDASTPAPRSTPVQPAAKLNKILKASGKLFEKFSSDLSIKDEEVMMRTIDDIGMTKFLEKNKIGRMVFSGEVGRSTAFNLMMGESQNGVHYGAWEGAGVRTRKSTLKILSKGNLFDEWKFKEGAVSGWSISQMAKTQRGAMQATYVHELGYHVTKTGRKVRRVGKRSFTVDAANSSADFVKTDNAIRRAFRNRKRDPLGRVSDYSEMNQDEYFAESFAAHAKDPVTLKVRDPVAFDMVEDVREIRGLDPVNRLIDGT